MDFNLVNMEAVYLIADDPVKPTTLQLFFGNGCGDSMVYSDEIAIKRLENLMPGFHYCLYLLKKEGGIKYKFNLKQRKFLAI